MSEAENDFGNAGDMISGSQNPQEHNDWLDQQQKPGKKRRAATQSAGTTLIEPCLPRRPIPF